MNLDVYITQLVIIIGSTDGIALDCNVHVYLKWHI